MAHMKPSKNRSMILRFVVEVNLNPWISLRHLQRVDESVSVSLIPLIMSSLVCMSKFVLCAFTTLKGHLAVITLSLGTVN